MKSSNGSKVVKDRGEQRTDLRLAIEIGDRIVCHSYKLPPTPSWLHFANFLQTKLSLNEFTVKYRDEDGDEVSLSSEDEFSEVLNVYDRINTVLLLRIIPIETDFPNKSEETVAVDADGFPKQENVNGKTQENKITNLNEPDEDKEKDKQGVNVDESHVVVDFLPLNITNGAELGCRPKENSVPPEWFTNFMEKFKGDVTLEITKKVMHRMQKLMIRNGCGAVKKEEAKSADEEKVIPKLSPTTNIVHPGVICKNCDQEVIGIRYKCGNCVKFDLCEDCECLKGIHEPHHVFVKMRYPCKMAGLRKHTGKMAPLLKHILYDQSEIPASDKINEGIKRANGDAIAMHEQPCGIREKKLLKRLEKQAHKLDKYQKHRQKFPERGSLDAILGGTLLRHRVNRHQVVEDVGRSSSDSGIVDRPGFNPFTIDLVGAKFLRDETFPDGTVVEPGALFTKRWRILNSGNKPWPSDTVLKCVFTNGLQARGNDVPVPFTPAGEDAILCMELIAPLALGSYESHWRLSHQNQMFGHKIWCSVVVDTKVNNLVKSHVINIPPDVQVEQVKENVQQEPENGEKEQVPDILKAGIDDVVTSPKWADFKSNENASANNNNNNGNSFGLLTPRSSTATPNNTPLDLTPPKSPEVPEDESESTFDDVGDGEASDRNDDDKDVSFLSEDSEYGGSLVSLSSTDSDLGYMMVPLPPCFNFTVPVVYENKAEASGECNNALSPEETLTAPVSPASKDENSSVTTVTDTDDENANESPAPRAEKIFVADESPAFTIPEKFKFHPAIIRAHLAANMEPTTNVPIPLPPPPPPSPPPAATGGRASGGTTPDVCPDRIIPIIPEPIMSAAATVFNSARGIITSFADIKTTSSTAKSETRYDDVSCVSMAQLCEMGFYDREENVRLLKKFNGDVTSVVSELLQETDNDWHDHRH